MLLGFFTGSYMVVGAAHRGTNFTNLSQILTTVTTVAILATHASFVWIAGAQLVITLLIALYLVFDFGRLAPAIKPTIRYWKPGAFMAIIKPSGYYALLYSSNFLSYQLPVLLIAAHPRSGGRWWSTRSRGPSTP